MKFYFCCLPPLDFPLAFLGSPVWVAARLVTLIPGPCLLVRISTQSQLPCQTSSPYTSLVDPLWWHASIPASGQGFHTRPKDIQSVVSPYLPERNSLSTARSPGTGALCPACHCLALCPWTAHFPPLSQILLHRLKACDQPTLGAVPQFRHSTKYNNSPHRPSGRGLEPVSFKFVWYYLHFLSCFSISKNGVNNSHLYFIF